MRQETNIEDVRNITKGLIRVVPLRCDNQFGLVQHPFTNMHIAYLGDGDMVDLKTEDGFDRWAKHMDDQIDRSDLRRIYMLVGTAWKLTWLKFIKPYLNLHDFSELLADCWTAEENPNMDANVSISTAIKWFKEADKQVLMSDEEYEYWKNIPKEITLYRGVSPKRKPFGLSWTDNEETAKWFQGRFATGNNKGKLLKVVAKKEHCLCYLNGRGEEEFVLNVSAVKKEIVEIQ